jgi:folate-dependent phosphoribosylglycinamide formyltransferase PurN
VDNSPFSRSVSGLCHAEPGIELAGIIVRKILNPARLRSELRRDGVRLVRKAWKKLVLGSEDGVADDAPGFNDIARDAGMQGLRLSAFARREGIRFTRVGDHNDAESLAALEEMRPDVVAFTGGGIIRQPLIDAAGRGIFNTHMGVLPRYRGMDVIEWPILEGEQQSTGLGVTLHFMDKGIDTGPIAKIAHVPIEPGDSVERLRKRFEPAMVQIMLDGLRAARDGALEVQPQSEGDGHQYFVMHPRFYQEVRRRLASLAN